MQLTGTQLTWITIATFCGFTACWIATFVCLRNEHKALMSFLTEGTLLRMVAVVFIVTGVVGLTLVDKLESAQTATILAGIAGYVLGGVPWRKSQPPSQNG